MSEYSLDFMSEEESGRRGDSGVVYAVGMPCVVIRGLSSALSEAGLRVNALATVGERAWPDAGRYTVILGPRLSAQVPGCLGQSGIAPERVLVMARPQSRTALRAVARGMAGSIGPGTPATEAVALVRAVLDGRAAPSAGAIPTVHAGRAMTLRQAEVLALTAQGCSTAETAADLCISERTVRNTLSALYRTLGVRDRAEAVAWAWATDWIHDAGPPPAHP